MLSDDMLRFVFVYDARFADALCKDRKNRNLSEEFEFERNNFGF